METIKHFIDFIFHINTWLAHNTSEYRSWTYLILFVIIFAETGFVVTPFLPGDSLLFATAALIAGGNSGLNIYDLGLILIVAAFAGNTVNYLLGNYLGPKVFKEHNKVLKLKYYTDTQAFFDRHGGKAVILSRFMPIIRTIAPFVAGVGRMPLIRYSLYNIIGGASWIILFLFAGYMLGDMPFFKNHFSIIEVIIILVSIIPAIAGFAKSRAARKTAVS